MNTRSEKCPYARDSGNQFFASACGTASELCFGKMLVIGEPSTPPLATPTPATPTPANSNGKLIHFPPKNRKQTPTF